MSNDVIKFPAALPRHRHDQHLRLESSIPSGILRSVDWILRGYHLSSEGPLFIWILTDSPHLAVPFARHMLQRRLTELVCVSKHYLTSTRLSPTCHSIHTAKARPSAILLSRTIMSATEASLDYPPVRADELKENLQGVQKEIEEAWTRAGEGSNRAVRLQAASEIQSHRSDIDWQSHMPRLVAISKLKPASDIQALYDHASHRHFGENYAQEMVDKARILPRDVKWHFVGSLQSNKAKLVASVPNLAVIETLGSIKLATALEKALAGAEKEQGGQRDGPLDVFLQVNTSGEEAKSGVKPMDDEELERILSSSGAESGSELLDLATHVIQSCPHLRLRGLMTIGALEASQSSQEDGRNPDFERLRKSRRNLLRALEARKLNDAAASIELELSMGMSADFAAAVGDGSDSVRVGTRIFGERPKKGGQ